MNIFGNALRHVLILSLSLMIFIQSNQAKAASGIVTGSPLLVTAGLVVGAAGISTGVITVVKATNCKDGLEALFTYLLGGMFTAAILGVGFIILDGEQAMQYSTLSAQDASKLAISESARQQYNSEIDQVNALASYVDVELSQLENATVEDSSALWASVKGAVSAQTFEVMQAVTVQIYK